MRPIAGFILGACLLIGFFVVRDKEKEVPVESIFEQAPIALKAMSGDFRLLSTPAEILHIITTGNVSLEDLRKLARNGSFQQRYWSLFCIGQMSHQQFDRDFVNELETTNDLYRNLGNSSTRRIMLQQCAQNSVRMLDKHLGVADSY